MASTKTTHHIPPDRTLMEDIGATSFTLAEAVVELVANSIDARRTGKSAEPLPLTVEVHVSPEEVSIKDDGRGMTEEILVQAVRLGVKMDEILGKQKRKGMYGLGLKTAAASIGRYWSVLTRPMDGHEDYFLEFDLEQYAKARTTSVKDWMIDVETRSRTKDSPLGQAKSGTFVVIRRLRDKTPSAGSVTLLLGEAFKPHIAAGDRIVVDGLDAKPAENKFLEGSRQEFDEYVGPGKKWRVRGWVALDSKTHNNGEYGFNLYREDQLIETWDKSWFRAHLMTSRIIGEAHIDFMPVNFNKQGFKTQSDEWLLTKEYMTVFLKPVVRASQEANRGRGDESKLKRAVQGMKRALGGAPVVIEDDEGEDDDEEGKEFKPTAADQALTAVTHEKITLKGHEIYPSYIVEDWGSEVTPWDYTHEDFDEGKRTDVQAVLNSESLLYQTTSDTAILGLMAVADCVTRYLVEHRDIMPPKARELRDQWIHASLTSRQKKDDSKKGVVDEA